MKEVKYISPFLYDPLHDDAQCMALVKKFGLEIGHVIHDGHPDRPWRMFVPGIRSGVISADLNRAIVAAVAKTQASKA